MLVETDTKVIMSNQDYRIPGYETILQLVDEKNKNVRIMALVKNSVNQDITIRKELMSPNFPSIWIQVNILNFQEKTIHTANCLIRPWLMPFKLTVQVTLVVVLKHNIDHRRWSKRCPP